MCAVMLVGTFLVTILVSVYLILRTIDAEKRATLKAQEKHIYLVRDLKNKHEKELAEAYGKSAEVGAANKELELHVKELTERLEDVTNKAALVNEANALLKETINTYRIREASGGSATGGLYSSFQAERFLMNHNPRR